MRWCFPSRRLNSRFHCTVRLSYVTRCVIFGCTEEVCSVDESMAWGAWWVLYGFRCKGVAEQITSLHRASTVGTLD